MIRPHSQRRLHAKWLLTCLMVVALSLLAIRSLQAAPIGANDFRISDMGPNGTANTFPATKPDLAYNPSTQEYLVVWQGVDEADGIARIYGQRVNARSGADVGSNDFLIASMGTTAGVEAIAPAVAYNSTRNEFLVTFVGDLIAGVSSAYEIYGQRVAADGTLIGSRLRISDMGASDTNGSYDAFATDLAYNPTTDEYLVIWGGDDDTPPLTNAEEEVFGQRLGYDGSGNLVEVGSNDFRISVWGPNGDIGYYVFSREIAVAYNSSSNEYLAVWAANDEATAGVPSQVQGQRLSATGAALGGNFRIDLPSSGNEARDPDVAYNPTTNQYLVVWQGENLANDFEIWGQRLSATATPVGGNVQISQSGPAGSGATYLVGSPSVAYNPELEEFLVVWQGEDDDFGLVDAEQEVFGRRYSGALSSVEGPFRISDLGGTGNPNFSPEFPAVAYSTRAINTFLVVWRGDNNVGGLVDNEFEIFGQFVAANVDLRVTKVLNTSANPAPGEAVQYTLTYTNLGPDPVFNVVLTDLLPSELTGVSFTISDVTGSAPVQRAGPNYIWDIARLDPGQGGTITISGQVVVGAANGTVVNNTATIDSTTLIFDSNTTNNSQLASFTVDVPPQVLAITRMNPDPTNAASVQFLVTFSEPVLGGATSNFTLVPGGSVSGASITAVSGSGNTRIVTVNTGTGDGTLGLNLTSSAGVSDASGKALIGLPFSGETYTIDKTAPSASVTVSNITSDGGTTHSFTVQYSDNLAINVASLNSTDIRVTGPNGYDQLATFIGVDINSNGTPRTATYQISAPGGSWDLADTGIYTIAMEGNQVFDSAGNAVAAGTLGSFSVTVDTVAPDTTITASPLNPSNSTTATFTFSGTDNLTLPNNLIFECALDAAPFTACTSPISYSGLSDGSHTFAVRAIDQVGNVDPTPASFTWLVDTLAPTTSATVSGSTSPLCPSDCYIDSATVTLAASDNGSGVATLRYRVNGGAFQTYSTPFTIFTEGTNTVEFFAIDNAGNIETTRSITVKVTTFPDTGVLDNFNRANGGVGNNWQGARNTDQYRIAGQEVLVDKGGYLAWGPTEFGSNQEAFMTLTQIVNSEHHPLLLKARGTNASQGGIIVAYDALGQRVVVEVLVVGQGWRTVAAFPVTMSNGHQLGARARADGTVQVYVNCMLLGTADTRTVAGNAYVNQGGRIGVWFQNASGARFDNFGGGNSTP